MNEDWHAGLDGRKGDGVGFAEMITGRCHQTSDCADRWRFLKLLVGRPLGLTAPGRPLAFWPCASCGDFGVSDHVVKP